METQKKPPFHTSPLKPSGVTIRDSPLSGQSPGLSFALCSHLKKKKEKKKIPQNSRNNPQKPFIFKIFFCVRVRRFWLNPNPVLFFQEPPSHCRL